MLRTLLLVQPLGCLHHSFQGLRFLYTAKALGLDTYVAHRAQTKFKMSDPETQERFLSRVHAFLTPESANKVYVADLETMLYLSEGTAEEIEIVTTMLQQYQIEKTKLLSGESNVLGPVVMRFLHFTNKPLVAYDLIRNPKFYPTFTQFKSFQIAMDLTLTSKMYSETVDIFSVVEKRFINKLKTSSSQQYPSSCLILCVAALYKMNSSDSYRQMLAHIEKAQGFGIGRMRRVLAFSAALAIRQNHPEVALRILSFTVQQSYITIRNLNMLAMARLGHFPSVFHLLRLCIDQSSSSEEHRPTVILDVFEAVGQAVHNCQDQQIKKEFDDIESACQKSKAIDNRSLDSILNQTIDWKAPAIQKIRESRGKNVSPFRSRSFDFSHD